MSEEAPPYPNRTTVPRSSSSSGSVSAGAAASGDAAGCLLGSSKQRDRDYSPLAPYYRDAWVTLYHGDNCDVLGTLPRECVDVVVTSPPYDDLRTYGGKSWDFFGVAWQLCRVLKDGGVIVWIVGDATKDGSETGSSMEQALHFRRLGLNLHDTMIYAKNGPPYPDATRYQQVFEYMFVLSKGAPKAINLIADRENRWAGAKNFGTRTNRQKDGELSGSCLAGRTVREKPLYSAAPPGVTQAIWLMPPSGDRSDKRSETPPGFAKAVYESNKHFGSLARAAFNAPVSRRRATPDNL